MSNTNWPTLNRNNNEVETPEELYNEIKKEWGPFNFDPCPINPQFDGLKIEWGKKNFVNPPYNNKKKFLLKAVEESKKGKTSVFLIPMDCQCNYWKDIILKHADELYLITDYVKFKGYNKPFPKPLCIIVFRPGESEKRELIGDKYKFLPVF